jgi:hypothetical protein
MEGTAPDGSLLVNYEKTFRCDRVQFNIDIPDSFFELEIPKKARFNDLLTGMGWLDQAKRPSLLFPTEGWGRRVLVAAIVLVAVSAVSTAVFCRRWRSAGLGA